MQSLEGREILRTRERSSLLLGVRLKRPEVRWKQEI
jgi:hypothetical protein